MHSPQSLQDVLLVRSGRLIFLIDVLKSFWDDNDLMFELRFDHKYRPRYLSLCFAYLTVLNLGILKSEFLRLCL